VSNAIRDAMSPLAEVAYDAFIALAAKEANATRGECDPAVRKKQVLPLSFAFQGTGNLFPFETGVVSGLYARGVLTPEIARTAHFGGLSGGGVTSVLTALGFTAEEQGLVAANVFTAIKHCLEEPRPEIECKQWPLTIPVLKAAILAKDPNAVRTLSGRLTLWTCQVDALSDSNKHSITQGTSKVSEGQGRTRASAQTTRCWCSLLMERPPSSARHPRLIEFHPRTHTPTHTHTFNSGTRSTTSSPTCARPAPSLAVRFQVRTRTSGATRTLTARSAPISPSCAPRCRRSRRRRS
jgi:hypothetical protein